MKSKQKKEQPQQRIDEQQVIIDDASMERALADSEAGRVTYHKSLEDLEKWLDNL